MGTDLGDLRRADHPVLVVRIAGPDARRDVGVIFEHGEKGGFCESEGGEGGLGGGVEVRDGEEGSRAGCGRGERGVQG